MKTVILLEDDPIARSSLEGLVEASGFKLIGAADRVSAAMDLIASAPDFFIVDLQLIDGAAFGFIDKVKKTTRSKVLVVSMLGDEASVVEAIQSGADGYILKDASREQLVAAINSILVGEAPISPAIARHLLRTINALPRKNTQGKKPALLTRREIDVLEGLAQGMNYKEVARKFELSHHTVAQYIKTIYRKLEVTSRAEAVIEGVKKGFITIGGGR